MKSMQSGYEIALALIFISICLFAACNKTKEMSPPCLAVNWERQTCFFPLTPNLDGNLDDSVWQEVHWESVEAYMGKERADGGDDASFEFACAADAHFIYFAFRVKDNVIDTGDNNIECQYYNDDSIEVYLDQRNNTNTYSGDDAQIIIKADNIGLSDTDTMQIDGCAEKGISGDQTKTRVYAHSNEEGGWQAEIAIPLKLDLDTDNGKGWQIEPVDGNIIGFQTGYNDDDNGGIREHKLIWSKNDWDNDCSYQYTGCFGELQFCHVWE